MVKDIQYKFFLTEDTEHKSFGWVVAQSQVDDHEIYAYLPLENSWHRVFFLENEFYSSYDKLLEPELKFRPLAPKDVKDAVLAIPEDHYRNMSYWAAQDIGYEETIDLVL